MSDRYGQGGSRALRVFNARILQRDNYQCRIGILGICTGRATEVDHIRNLASLGLMRNERAAMDPSNACAACRECHRYKTERERVKALAESNRQRAEARRARLGRKPRPHPGDD